MIIIKAFLSKKCLTRLIWPNRDIHEDTVETICSLFVLYYYIRNFCNLIGLEHWYFSLI